MTTPSPSAGTVRINRQIFQEAQCASEGETTTMRYDPAVVSLSRNYGVDKAMKAIAQLGLFRNRSRERAWDQISGETFWLNSGRPFECDDRCDNMESGVYGVAEGRYKGATICSRCIELLPVFKLADGTIIDGRL